jgi:CheY-like chemotaxis protein
MAALTDAAAAGDPFEIAIIDLELPASGGLALAHAIKRNPQLSRTRVVGVHEFGDGPVSASTEAAGIRALIARPLRQSRLYNTLVALMASLTQDGVVELTSPNYPARTLKSVVPAEIRERVRILLVEDNLVNQRVAMHMIERIGYKAERVDSGRDALERLDRGDCDLILMDCQMPGMDGCTATREIRRREGATRHTPIIGLTARALASDREDCIRAGMDDYLSKPVSPEDLGAKIDKWVMALSSQRTLAPEVETVSTDASLTAPCGAPTPLAEASLDEAVLAELREYQKPGEPDFVTELIGIFKGDLTNRLSQMRAGLQAGDAKRVCQAAHALKGGSGELGAGKLREICGQLESSTAHGSLEAGFSIMQGLEAEAERVLIALASHCVAAPPAGS